VKFWKTKAEWRKQANSGQD